MVADVHRTLLYGGIFMYPADKKTGKGKLRILYEGFPMSMIIEQAGGVASTGLFQGSIQRILDLTPSGIHDKCPVIVGCERDVNRVLACYAGENLRSEEHTSELQSLMHISYAVFCLKKKKHTHTRYNRK